MSTALAALLGEANATGSTPKFILDAASYAQRVLLQNRDIPWHDATAYSNHLSQAQALLKPEVALVPLDRLLKREIHENDVLREEMSSRTRTGFAAKTLLADESLRNRAHELIATAVLTQREPVVLHLPSPLGLLMLTSGIIDPASTHEFDNQDAENTAIYFADWLRTFASVKISGIIFDERAGAASEESYKPILNIAEHYRWPIGLRATNAVRFSSPEAMVPVLDPSVFSENTSIKLPSASMLLAEIPEHAVPEQVLSRLAALRTA